MKVNLLIRPSFQDGYLICFRLLSDRFVGKHFPGNFRSADLRSDLVGWEDWPFLEGDALASAEMAEKSADEERTRKAKL